jgi:hypothetical protein
MGKEDEFSLTPEDRKKLISLLQYANEAIDYWFDGCDVTEQIENENEEKKRDCEHFIQKLNMEE